MFSGRNSDTNKVSVVNVDDNGKIKIDESGKLTSIDNRLFQIYGPTFAGQINLQNIDTKMNGLIDIIDNTEATNTKLDTNNTSLNNIETNTDTTNTNLLNTITELQNINVQGIKSNLSYLRSQGRCYTVNGSGITGNTDNDYIMLSLWNPVGSGKTVYVYGGDFSLNGSGLTSGYFQLQIKRLTTQPTGTAKTPSNLKLDVTTAPSVELKQNATISASNNIYNSRQVNSNDSGDLDYHQNIILYHEMIEIPSGYGLALNGFRSASNNVYFYYNVRFIEV
jgi:hypothetical protein